MSDTLAKALLVICLVGLLGAIAYFYLFPFATQSWTMAVIFLPSLLLAAIGLFAIPEAIKKIIKGLSYLKHGFFFLWFNLFIISVWLFRSRSSLDLAENPVDAAALVRILSVAIAGVTVFAIGIGKRKDVIRQLWRGLPGLMFIYGLIGLASALYSPYRMLTIYKSCEVIVDVAMIAFFLSCYSSRMNTNSQTNMRNWINLNWYMVALLIASVWIGVILSPNQALLFMRPDPLRKRIIPFMVFGVWPRTNPNGLGTLASLLSIATLSRTLHARNQKERAMYLVLLIASLVTLVLAQSRTSLFGGAAALITVLVFNKRIKPLAAILLFLPLALLYTGLPSILTTYVLRGQNQEQFVRMSGRLTYWSIGWEKFKESPIYGHGFAAGVRYVVLLDINSRMSTMHNGWLEVLVNVGILGMIPIALAFTGTLWTLLRTILRPRIRLDPAMRMLSVEMIALLVLQTFRFSTGGSSFMHDRGTLLFLLAAAFAQQIRNYERTGAELPNNEDPSGT